MKEKLSPVAYPTTKEEAFKWGFDVYQPKSTPMAWILDWKSASAGFGVSPERRAEVVEFRTGEDLSRLTVDDVIAGHSFMFKIHWHSLFKSIDKLSDQALAAKVARDIGYNLGKRGWELLQLKFGKPVPLEKIVWYQDCAHLLYGPDTHAYSWCDNEKSVCSRQGCLFRPPESMCESALYCRTFDNAYIEAYMDVEPDLYCVRVPDLGNDSSGKRCVHMWTYNKKVIENMSDELKSNIADTTVEVLKKKGVNL